MNLITNKPSLKIAFVHDWLTNKGGGENVLEAMLELYPSAPIFTLLVDPDGSCKPIIDGRQIYQSFLSKLPFVRKWYRNYLPLMPLAIEQLDLRGYDVIVSTSHAVAKGVITGPDQIHISYVHTPIRYVWDLYHQYLQEANLTNGIKSIMARILLHYIRNWDYRTANGVDYFLCNSEFVARRIMKVYRRKADIIYPPVDTDGFTMECEKEEFYLAVSRMVPYKKMDLIVDAFSKMPEKRLVVIGAGPDFSAIKKRAGSNVEMLGYQPTEELKRYMQRAKALIFAAEEDFGIVPVESQACGTPVIAYKKGGVLETVIPGKTGIFFKEQTVESLTSAVRSFENMSPFDPHALRIHAEKFSKVRFQERFKAFVEEIWLKSLNRNTRDLIK